MGKQKYVDSLGVGALNDAPDYGDAKAQAFVAIGATAADNFGVEMPEDTIGSSLLEQLV